MAKSQPSAAASPGDEIIMFENGANQDPPHNESVVDRGAAICVGGVIAFVGTPLLYNLLWPSVVWFTTEYYGAFLVSPVKGIFFIGLSFGLYSFSRVMASDEIKKFRLRNGRSDL